MTTPGSPHPQPIGVVLAGGAGRRLGGAKASVRLRGRPLIDYPLAALGAVLTEVVVLAKPDVSLPELGGVRVWREPMQPRHPLFGILCALERAAPRAALVCAADMPFVSPALIARIAGAPADVAIAAADGRAQPLVGLYRPITAERLRSALTAHPQISLSAAVRALEPLIVEATEREVYNVNTPADLAAASALLSRR